MLIPSTSHDKLLITLLSSSLALNSVVNLPNNNYLKLTVFFIGTLMKLMVSLLSEMVTEISLTKYFVCKGKAV